MTAKRAPEENFKIPKSGEWKYGIVGGGAYLLDKSNHQLARLDYYRGWEDAEKLGNFLVSVPKIIAERDRLKAENEKLKERHEFMYSTLGQCFKMMNFYGSKENLRFDGMQRTNAEETLMGVYADLAVVFQQIKEDNIASATQNKGE